jgi:hypothetical protein
MEQEFPRRRRILYVGTVAPGQTSAYRMEALEALGQDVRSVNVQDYAWRSRVGSRVQFRWPFGPMVAGINRAIVEGLRTFEPEVVWLDKPTMVTPETMDAIRAAGAKSVFYVQDAPFGPRKDGCWGQFQRTFRKADLHCLFRKADVKRYEAWGLPWIETMFSYDPRMHFPPETPVSEAERDRGVSYIGHPHEKRPEFLVRLAREFGLPVCVNGSRWDRVLNPEERQQVRLGGYLANDAYREGIWRSKINLSFVTEDNEDDIAHKAVEIAACGGFLMAVRTPGHEALFEEDKEAVFFSSVEECAEKARFYLGRPDLREAIGARARERAVRSGYDNDSQLGRVLNRLDGADRSG